ncbi:hypothetical protein [Mycobacterium aquaticum]|uniref:Uncharacterized protein n=1 Tax=Mycobacterium aquaticum TaxID=1927124 RepID=A0A1X0B8M5_9MYCO|nr:hypothetical protein [Mycobacterium aquaticum]ORA38711.1 hypothetical protein BST13_04845 [Mycobacterium aquaticum]
MIDFSNLTPAGGVVEYHVWPVHDGQHDDILIEGSPIWRRPVTGLIGDMPVVAPESGGLMLASDYLDTVLPRELQADHSNRGQYRADDFESPIGDAPVITVRERQED